MLFVTVYNYLKCWNVYQSKPIKFICCFFFQQTVVIAKNFLLEKILPNLRQQNQFLQGWNLSIQKLQLEYSLLENVGKMEKKIPISKNRTVVCQNFTNGVSNYVSKVSCGWVCLSWILKVYQVFWIQICWILKNGHNLSFPYDEVKYSQ